MTDEKWENLIDQVEQKFGEVERKKEELDFGPGEKEIIVFSGALGKMKLERIQKPLVLGQRGIRAKMRAGAGSTVEYLYSDTEKVDRIHAFRWDDKENDWVEIDMGSFGA